MKKKLSALLCALCMAMALCMSFFADTALPKLSAAAALSEGNKQVTVTLSLSGMENGKYTNLKGIVAYDNTKVKLNSVAAGDVFDSFDPSADINDRGDRVIILPQAKSSTSTNGTVATLTFDVLDGAEGDIVFNVSGEITYYVGETLDPETSDLDATSAKATIVVATPTPTVVPTATPTATPVPTTEPTAAPTTEPTAAPTTAPTAAPTSKPTAAPTSKPTAAPTAKPAATSKPASSDKSTTTATATAAPAATTTTTAAIPQTGDNANLALYAVLCVASAIALGVVVYRKKANH